MGSTIRLVLSCALALTGLVLYGGKTIDPNTFQLDPTMVLGSESWKGETFTASAVGGIEKVVASEQRRALTAAERGCSPLTILWLGNSQLHYINQFQRGERLAPYWLRRELACPDTTVPLGFSLPNANLQEHYVIARYVTERLPVRALVISLVFDDLREDGLRDEFADTLKAEDRQALKTDPVAREIVSRAESHWGSRSSNDENAGLEGFVQKRLEDALNEKVGAVSSLWADRANLRSRVLTDLYWTRNALLGIKATTIRKSIPDRYERNMRALEALLSAMRKRNIPVIGYIAPIRQDHPLPYDRSEYARWKDSVQTLASRYGAKVINMEELIPPRLWGAYNEGQIDFMHFTGPGHRILAEALLPHVRAVAKPVTPALQAGR